MYSRNSLKLQYASNKTALEDFFFLTRIMAAWIDKKLRQDNWKKILVVMLQGN